MRLLALDTATEACSAALICDGAVSERFELIGRGHADRLLPMAHELLSQAGIGVRDLDAVAFGRGPGGFTGLRIAAAVAQGLAAAAGRPVVAVSDLAALAVAGARVSGHSRILACLDARMGQVYWGAFEVGQGAAQRTGPERLSNPEVVEPPAGEAWFGAGHGFAAYPQIASRPGSRIAAHDASLLPRASDIARLGERKLLAGRGIAPSGAQPVYLRDEVVHKR